MSPYELPAVLICDSESSILRVFDATFGQHFRVFRCTSTREALTLLEQRRGEIGVVISELCMPGMSGVEFLERAHTLAPDARRMVLTAGGASSQDVLDAVNRGQVTRYFIKPWNRAELLAALADALRSARQELKSHEVEGRMKAERLATLRQVTDDIAQELMGPVGYLSQNVAALRRDLEQVIGYVNKHLAQDNDRDVAETVKDLPMLIGDLVTVTDHLRQVARQLKAQVPGDETQ